MKKLFIAAFMLFGIMVFANPEPLRVDLTNWDVRNVLIDANKAEGYKLISVYKNEDGKVVLVFSNGKEGKTFVSSK